MTLKRPLLRPFLPLTLLAASMASAQIDGPLDCSVFNVPDMTYLMYKVPGSPEGLAGTSFQTFSKGDFELTACGYTISNHAGVTSFRAANLQKLLNLLSVPTAGLLGLSGVGPINQTKLQINSVTEIKDAEFLGSKVYDIYEYPITVDFRAANVFTPEPFTENDYSRFKDVTINYSINGGALMTYAKDGQPTSFPIDGQTRTLDFYIDRAGKQGFGRVRVDLQASQVTVWTDYPFPQQ
ncbi:hypothetical protein [Deinococcus ruber]|uniref:Uncharacterized protein n=1 Tax=Deinococcus ruber TaxID=1848197 RepID=A0A918F5T3_9DEIO|nr:hypothetical protein [Deinococcus ruber]GGR11672.1 hypothetical protein GCM10008957_25860 [Deinococcus ruber]